jgi:hypothetical protein
MIWFAEGYWATFLYTETRDWEILTLSKLRLNKWLASNQVLSYGTQSRKITAAVSSVDRRRSVLEETQYGGFAELEIQRRVLPTGWHYRNLPDPSNIPARPMSEMVRIPRQTLHSVVCLVRIHAAAGPTRCVRIKFPTSECLFDMHLAITRLASFPVILKMYDFIHFLS